MNPSHRFPLGTIRHLLVSFLTLSFLGAFSTQPFAAVIRVPGEQPTIAAAITAAQSGDEIWVNGGTYKESLNLKSGVLLFGGFAGSETSRDERDRMAHPVTIDSTNPIKGTLVTTVTLDSFNITCSAKGGQEMIYMSSCSNFTFANCSVENTTCTYIVTCGYQSIDSSFKSCRFTNNISTNGISIQSASVDGCVILNNTCGYSTLYLYNGALMNSILAGNRSLNDAPAVHIDTARIINCTIANNGSDGIGYSSYRPDPISNTIIAGNKGYGIQLNEKQYVPAIRNCLFENTSGTMRTRLGDLAINDVISLNLFLNNEARNVDGNPHFANPGGDNFHIMVGSNAAGRGTLVGAPSLDIEGHPRPGADGLIDIGAYEATPPVQPESDTTPPASYIEDLPASSAGTTISLSYRAADNGTGVDYLQLFYRKDKQAWITLPDHLTTSPLTFNVTAAGGSGFYEFYTIATDKSGNIEAAPADGDTSTTIIGEYGAARVYVSLSGTAPRTGESWQHALSSIDQAIVIANGFHLPEVWIAKGVYSQDVHFRANVALYGGFAGNETLRDQRNWDGNVTEITGFKKNASSGYSENPVLIDHAANTSLDGISISNFGGWDYNYGEYGVRVVDAANTFIRNCNICGPADARGFGVLSNNSELTIQSCQFQSTSVDLYNTTATLSGSLIYGYFETALFANSEGWPSPPVRITNSAICGNTVNNEYVVFLEGSDTVMDSCIVSGNLGTDWARAIESNSANVIIRNTIISGNRTVALRGEATVINCTFDSNNFKDPAYGNIPPEAVCCVNPKNTINCIFSNIPGTVLNLSDLYHTSYVRNCLFDKTTRITAAHTAVNEFNMFCPSASGNKQGDPLYVMDGPAGIKGHWTADAECLQGRTVLKAPAGSFLSSALAGHLINPQTSQIFQAYVLSNTDSQVTLAGLYPDIKAGDQYKVIDYRLQDGSAAIDRGDPVYGPAADIGGNPRPGADGLVDIGVYESDPSFQPAADHINPESIVYKLPDMITTTVLPVTYTASDAETGVRHVELFYMRDNGGWFQYGDTYTTSPIMFDTRKAGGDGYYQFISFATDNAGNREPWPSVSDDATRVINSYSGKRIYVNANNFFVGDGTSWAQAMRTINQALEVARKNAATEIWVAQGTYNEFITLGSNMHLLGGFSGAESNPEQRDLNSHKAVIDEGANSDTKGAAPVVSIVDTTSTLIDGFTVKRGIGKGSQDIYYRYTQGGGIYCDNSNNCKILNCDIRENIAGNGGGVFIGNCAPLIEKCKIRFNTGGGFEAKNASPIIRDCVIEGNTGGYAAGRITGGVPTIENCIFTMNQSETYPGTLIVGDSSTTIRNCTISNNTVKNSYSDWGAISTYNYFQKNKKVSVSNCIITSNNGYGIVDSKSTSNTLQLNNNLFYGNAKGDMRLSYVATYATAEEVNSSLPYASGNMDGNPRFIMNSPDGIAGTWTADRVPNSKTRLTAYTDQNASFAPNGLVDSTIVFSSKTSPGIMTGVITSNTQTTVYSKFNGEYNFGNKDTTYTIANFHISSSSPAIDAGVRIEGLNDDVNGNSRPVHGSSQARGDGSWYDIGADEFQFLIRPEFPVAQKPVNISPANGSERISQTPVLEASAFALGGTHCMSDWQVAVGDDFQKLVLYSREDTRNLTRIQLPSDMLKSNGLYSWRVRYRGSSFLWSEWSEPTSFRVAPAGVVRVPADHSTIQQAIDAAQEGSEIVVSPGTYFENLRTRGKNVSLRSANPLDPGIVASTIIDGQSSASVVSYLGTEDERSALEGFTIAHGKSKDIGGGICGGRTRYSGNYSYPPDSRVSISHNTIVDNEALAGGGIAFVNGPVFGNIITDNYAEFGGGLASCGGTISSNQITSNTASTGGGGIYGYTPGKKGIIERNEISRNWALAQDYYGYGGGGILYYEGIIRNNYICSNTSLANGGGLDRSIGVNEGNVVGWNWASGSGGGYNECADIRNSIIAANKAREAGGVSGSRNLANCTVYGNIARSNAGGVVSSYQITNCILWGNEAPSNSQGVVSANNITYSCIQNWTYGGTGNISLDPRFLDPAHGDYHLAPNSPCIDAGTSMSGVTLDYQGYARPFFGVNERRGDGSGFDIGASEFMIPVGQPAPYEYALDSLMPGKRVYGDREYVFADSVPAPLLGRTYIRMLNADRAKTGASIVTFKLWTRASVWVAIDARVTKIPGWLADWQATDLRLRTTDPNAERILYRKDFQAGTITLGSNVPGESLDASMYTVIIAPQDHVETRANEVWELY